MGKSIGWEHYRTLLAVLAEGSLSGAARRLDITQPTAGRHIAALEVAFGQTLFTRSQTGLLPTETALALRIHAEAMESSAAALARVATEQSGEIAGVVRISASEVMAVEVLPPILATLRHTHPQLIVELVSTNQVQDLLHREADIAVRMAAPTQEMLVARRIGDVALGLYAHTAYLERHGEPVSLEELTDHALIGFDQETPFLRAAAKHFPIWKHAAFSLRCDSDLAQLALLRAACGIGVCQLALARQDPRLRRVLADHFTYQLPTWVTMHEGLRHSPRSKAAFDMLVSGLQAYVASQ